MNNIVLDFRQSYTKGEQLLSSEIVYQHDTGRIIEAYVTDDESYVLHVGYDNDATLSVIGIDSVTEDTIDGGYKILATLPDEILERYGTLLVYVVAVDGDMTITTYEGSVPVQGKAEAVGEAEAVGAIGATGATGG